jgi:hypothetical protein
MSLSERLHWPRALAVVENSSERAAEDSWSRHADTLELFAFSKLRLLEEGREG